MRMQDYEDELCRRLKDFSADTKKAVKLNVNNLYQEIWNQGLYWFARRELTLDTVAPYNTGTITIANGSASLTGNGTAFTSAMVGRKLVVEGIGKSYKIKTFVGVSSLTLDTVWIETSKVAAAYNIYKDIYTLNDRVQKVLLVRQNYSPQRMGELRKRVIEEAFPFYATPGTPTNYCPIGQTDTAFYSSGTISVVSGSISASGASTAWDSSMVDRVIKIKGDANEYRIATVAGVSSLTLANAYEGTTASAANYEIGPPGVEQIQLLPICDKVMQVKYDAIVRPLKLLNANDVPELPEHWHYILLEGAFLRLVPTHLADSLVAQMAKQTFDDGMEKLKSWHGISEDEMPAIVDRVGVIPMNKDYRAIYGS